MAPAGAYDVRVFLYVAIGAALGGMSRFALAGFIQQRAGVDFPAGTLLVNITGSLLLGFLMRVLLQSTLVTPEMRAMLTTGFCGGYTTFSTFSYETALLLEDGEYGRAALYVGSSVAVSLVGTFLGFVLAHRLLAFREQA
jgi:CrcB protein